MALGDITPPDIAFSRENFFAGGPDGDRFPLQILVVKEGGSAEAPLYRFNQMLVFQVTQLDAEHTSFAQASNRTVKLYSFERALMSLAVQALVIDAEAKTGDDEPRAITQQAYQELLWLYENELKISVATLKRRTIIIRTHGMSYYGYFTSMTDGWAADADHMVPVSFEFMVLRAETLALPSNPSRLYATANTVEARNAVAVVNATESGVRRVDSILAPVPAQSGAQA